MFSAIRSGRGVLVVAVAYVAPLISGALLVVFMILPLFWRSRKRERPMWVDRTEEPLLFAYIDKLCDVMRAPRAARIDLTASANASAHIDNGLLGLVRRRMVLTVGLPLARSMDLRQFTGVMAHELGHFAQGGSTRLLYVVQHINLWFLRLAYSRGRADDIIDAAVGNEPHWTIALIGLMSKLVLFSARLVLKLLALVSHGLSMHLSRQAEFDADRQAARIVGSEAMGNALMALPAVSAANETALQRAQAGWARRTLPDDLVVMTDIYRRAMAEEDKDKLAAMHLSQDTSWFDTHPPLFVRVGKLKKAKLSGLLKLDASATCLFRDFDELSKVTTIRLYQTILGDKLQPEHLVPTQVPVSTPVKRTPTSR
jgi:Zn-dependent protease with chaperone function